MSKYRLLEIVIANLENLYFITPISLYYLLRTNLSRKKTLYEPFLHVK